MRLYLDHNVKIASPPAIDRSFKTIDYLAVFDLHAISDSVRKAYLR